VADEIIATGTSKTPLMGVQLDPAYSDVGARVSSVTAGSGAEAASLREGDIVLVVDGRPIADATELVVAIRSYAPGDTIEIEFERDGRIQTAELVLGDDSKAK
jgi:putative serine protease PepD